MEGAENALRALRECITAGAMEIMLRAILVALKLNSSLSASVKDLVSLFLGYRASLCNNRRATSSRIRSRTTKIRA